MLVLTGSPAPTGLESARELAAAKAKKKGEPNDAIGDARLEWFEEGKAAQVLHLGPYSEEPPTIAALHEFISASGYQLRGKHHEIYISDATRTAPSSV